jgi:hypothetical protein
MKFLIVLALVSACSNVPTKIVENPITTSAFKIEDTKVIKVRDEDANCYFITNDKGVSISCIPYSKPVYDCQLGK